MDGQVCGVLRLGGDGTVSAADELGGAERYASFPWYNLLEMRPAIDAFYATIAGGLRERGIRDVPRALDRGRPHGTDRGGTCFFTQTCGYPLLTTARGHFRVLGAPRYNVAGCAGHEHRSAIVVRVDRALDAPSDLRGGYFAINERDSNSGMNLPRRLFAPLARDGRFFATTIVTGSHVESAALVARGDADAAAIDCVTLALLARHRPSAVAPLRTIAYTASSPTPPLVTSRHASDDLVAALRAAVRDAISGAGVRASLALVGLDDCDATAYDVLMRYEREASDLGYPELV